jgi:hypothetical protein
MKERPILFLFSSEMVLAILDGSKTQTRRVCKPRFDDRKPCEHYSPIGNGGVITNHMMRHCEHGSEGQPCPYGETGDRLWVRETFTIVPRTAYRCSEGVQQTLRPNDDHDAAIYRAGWDRSNGGIRWRPSRYMPRWASRIALEVDAVRVERVQDITEADAKAEGPSNMIPCGCKTGTRNRLSGALYEATYREGFCLLWNSINAKRGYGWDANPWVWVVGFKRAEVSQ